MAGPSRLKGSATSSWRSSLPRQLWRWLTGLNGIHPGSSDPVAVWPQEGPEPLVLLHDPTSSPEHSWVLERSVLSPHTHSGIRVKS